MRKALTVFMVTIVVLALCLIMFAMTIDADAAELSPDCPKPPLRPQIWLPVVEQYLPTWWDGDNSGDAVGGER